ncbi:MAG: hypothetical protein E6J03_10530 [Chloroflexi bacterium]|nr:MAG: hypothetical protein E6J03_10530 [Chloroflexota bacterium]
MAAKARAQGEGGAAVTGTDALVQAAETLIVRGKEQGYLTPDDILQAFPEIEAEPDHLERIFSVFREMGIEVSDGGWPCSGPSRRWSTPSSSSRATTSPRTSSPRRTSASW